MVDLCVNIRLVSSYLLRTIYIRFYQRWNHNKCSLKWNQSPANLHSIQLNQPLSIARIVWNGESSRVPFAPHWIKIDLNISWIDLRLNGQMSSGCLPVCSVLAMRIVFDLIILLASIGLCARNTRSHRAILSSTLRCHLIAPPFSWLNRVNNSTSTETSRPSNDTSTSTNYDE